jgi:hypothetical protein
MSYRPVATSRYWPAKPIAEVASVPVAPARVAPNAFRERVPDMLAPEVPMTAVTFAKGSLSSQELDAPDVSTRAAPVEEVGSVSHAVAREPV